MHEQDVQIWFSNICFSFFIYDMRFWLADIHKVAHRTARRHNPPSVEVLRQEYVIV